MESEDVALFREYLRIPSVTRDIAQWHEHSSKFFEEWAAKHEFQCRKLEYHPGFPVVLITWPGTQPDLPSVLLNSHVRTGRSHTRNTAHSEARLIVSGRRGARFP
jgi:aminoacylase